MNIRTKLTPIVKISILHNQLRLSSRSAGELQLILTESKNCVTRVTMNNPAKLNGWTVSMLESLFLTLDRLAEDTETRAVILTGSDPYYSAGASLSENITLMHPKKLHSLILENNEKLFNKFLDFPKPILVAANGPCIGASVTSALLCDGIIASEAATFLTPFARLSVPAEGCSSVHFPRTLGREAADKMLKQGAKIGALEALEIGLVQEVVPHSSLLSRAQNVAEDWVRTGRARTIPGDQDVDEYKIVNKRESIKVADSFLSYNFLNAQENFLRSKGKKEARLFWLLKKSRPLWSRLL